MIFQIDEDKTRLIEALGVSDEELNELRDKIFGYVAAGFSTLYVIKGLQNEGLLDDPRRAFLLGLIIGYAVLNVKE